MNRNTTVRNWMRLLVLVLAWGGSFSSVRGAEVSVVRTNWTERWVTNLIEVQMPENVFVDRFRTNLVRQYRTNTVEMYETNEISVNAFRTNYVDRWRTNWKTLTLAKEVGVEAVRTNLVEQWRTNWKTLNLTNWKTILVMKTNWVDQPVTNVVELDLASNQTGQAVAKQHLTPDAAEPLASVQPGTVTEELAFEVSGTSRTGGDTLEVRLAPKWNAESSGVVRVQQWHVESENGAILCSGVDREFKRQLPTGRYKVDLRARREKDGAVLIARGNLAVSATDAVVVPKVAKR